MASARIFYDGGCGLCHGAVRFLARRDRAGRFRFAPLGGETFVALVPPAARRRLPDSLVLMAEDGGLYVRSAAVLRALREVGGGWALAARAGSLVPAGARDAVYDAVARVRRRLFARPRQSCPVLPPDLAKRFDP
jgi:predicted DCC family thiol-disulfide oxidoreductase YuxK